MSHICKDGTRRPRARSPASPRVMVIPLSFVLFLGLVAAAGAQTTPAEEPSVREAVTSLDEARRAAENAEAAAAEARALFERIDEARNPGPRPRSDAGYDPPGGRGDSAENDIANDSNRSPPQPPTVSSETDRAVAEAQQAAKEAREAAREARRVINEHRIALKAYRDRYARKGILIGVAGSYSLEDFDTRLKAKNSRGVAVFLGYRVHRHVSIEARGEYLEGFDVRADSPSEGEFDAELDGFLVTVGPKFYPLTGSLQPFVGFGLGGMRARLRGIDSGGSRFNVSETAAVVRFAAGLDYFLSANLVLNLEAAYVSPTGDLQQLDFATFSGGVTLRF